MKFGPGTGSKSNNQTLFFLFFFMNLHYVRLQQNSSSKSSHILICMIHITMFIVCRSSSFRHPDLVVLECAHKK